MKYQLTFITATILGLMMLPKTNFGQAQGHAPETCFHLLSIKGLEPVCCTEDDSIRFIDSLVGASHIANLGSGCPKCMQSDVAGAAKPGNTSMNFFHSVKLDEDGQAPEACAKE